MRIGRIGYGIRGFYRSADYALRMDTISKDAQVRAKILKFWKHYGLDATLAAFGRRVAGHGTAGKIYAKRQGGNLAALANRSRAPKQRRRRNWPEQVNAEIKRLRTTYPNLGRDKIHPLLSVLSPKLSCLAHQYAPSAG